MIPLRPQVRAAGIREQMVSAADFKGVIEDLIRAKQQFGIPFTTTMETDYKDEIYRDPIVRKKSSCAAGREATNLDYDADRGEFLVYACSYSPASDLSPACHSCAVPCRNVPGRPCRPLFGHLARRSHVAHLPRPFDPFCILQELPLPRRQPMHRIVSNPEHRLLEDQC